MGGTARLGGLLADVALVTFGFAYVGYPVALLARAAIAPQPYVTGPLRGRVSVVIAAHDEAQVIGAKLESVIAAAEVWGGDVEVVVADDGSSDDTAGVVESVAARVTMPISLLRLPRGGKAAALEAAVAAATGDFLVFTDANSMLAEHALEQLVAPFADSTVGGVAGDQRYDAGSGALGEQLHWSFDRWLKRAESSCGSTVSATGAFYAIRREHFTGVPVDVTDDFHISTGVVADGQRLVFAAGAVVTEPAAETISREYARKVRVMSRGLRGVLGRRGLMSPRHGFYALAFTSRKVVRRLVGPTLVLASVGSMLSWRRRRRYLAVAVGSLTAGALGAVGAMSPRAARRYSWIGLPTFACAAVAASTQAVINVVTGVRITRWDRPASPSSST